MLSKAELNKAELNNAEFAVESTPVALHRFPGKTTTTAAPITSLHSRTRIGADDSRVHAIANDPSWHDEHTEVLTDLDTLDIGKVLFTDSHGHQYNMPHFPFVIGRGSDCDLTLDGRGVSRRHVEVIYQSGRFIISDLKSLNGFRVNGFKVNRVILEQGDEIKLGDVALIFSFASNRQEKDNVVEPALDKRPGPLPSLRELGKYKPQLKLLGIAGISAVLTIVAWYGSHFWIEEQVESISGRSFSADVAEPISMPAMTSGVESLAHNIAPLAHKMPDTVGAHDAMDASLAVTSLAVNSHSGARFAAHDSEVQDQESDSTLFRPEQTGASSEQASSRPEQAPQAPHYPQLSAGSTGKADRSGNIKSSTKSGKMVSQSASQTSTTTKAKSILAMVDGRYKRGEAAGVIDDLVSAQSLGGLTTSITNELRQKHRQIVDLYQAYSVGNEAFNAGNKEEAFNQWMAFLDKEKALYGQGRRSVYAIEVESRVMQEYMDKAAAAKLSGDNHEAYHLWTQALALGVNGDAKKALENADLKAKQLYRKGLKMEFVNSKQAKESWQEVVMIVPPGTEYYTKATSKIEWYNQ